MVGGDPVDEAVSRLTRASEGDSLDPKEVSDVLRGLRAKAESEVRFEAKAETERLKAATVPAEQLLAALELIQQKATQEVDVRAKRYINAAIARFDQLGDQKDRATSISPRSSTHGRTTGTRRWSAISSPRAANPSPSTSSSTR